MSFHIGKGCGGLDGTALFSAVFLLWMGFQKIVSNVLVLSLTFSFGLLYCFILNCLRIALIIKTVAVINALSGTRAAYYWGLLIFHSQVGWLVYLTGILTFFYLVTLLFSKKNISRYPPFENSSTQKISN
jgi:exosortase/archaeosortase family protein